LPGSWAAFEGIPLPKKAALKFQRAWLAHKVLKYCKRESVVRQGPFRGMRYIREAWGSSYEAKLFGTYEMELHPVVGRWLRQRPRVILVAGAAEGFYAVGLARRLPHTKVIAFEKDERGRALLEELASLNGVSDNIEIRGGCDPQVFRESLEQFSPQFVLMDVEGDEQSLLGNEACQAGRGTEFLVELHPWVDRAISACLRKRFSDSHQISLISSGVRQAHQLPFPWLVRLACGGELLVRAEEGRPEPMNWLLAEPRPRTVRSAV